MVCVDTAVTTVPIAAVGVAAASGRCMLFLQDKGLVLRCLLPLWQRLCSLYDEVEAGSEEQQQHYLLLLQLLRCLSSVAAPPPDEWIKARLTQQQQQQQY